MSADPQHRLIGLSLGADLCWPAAFEEILEAMDLTVDLGDGPVSFSTERVVIEPFDLQYQPRYDVVLDRITHWYHISREWVKKIALMDGVYVLNNPWAIQSVEKHTSYCAMMRLGFPIPQTWMIPPKTPRESEGDVGVTVRRYGKLFDLAKVAEQVGYPAFLKPYDGGGWVGVRRVTSDAQLHAAYDDSGDRVQHLQAGVKDWDLFVRAIGIGPQVLIVKYDPDAPLHKRYVVDYHFLDAAEWQQATRICRTINAFFNWDFNSCEMLRADGVLHPIDFANACPDSQVTSLHYYFPELVKALLRWTLFCAATKRKPKLDTQWGAYLAIADGPGSFDEKLERYDALAREHFDADAFAAFCKEHLADLDEVAVTWFQTPRFREVVRAKVAALFPAHEVEMFTDHFTGLVHFWARTERERLDRIAAPAGE
ncbi:MAG: hypothetical protein H6742_15085 [Alphaproteobacteria bacterium]|nr:hypothetical protein [Alphaproteobacteria bacterium]